MDESVKKVVNPYERLKEIKEKLKDLTKEEISLRDLISKGKEKTKNNQQLDTNTSEQFYLIIEESCLENSINWFEVYYLGYLKHKQQIEDKVK